ncbi:MAG: hypothetical protein ACREP6_03310 [Candidatus Binataceae bacterium]
MINRPASLLAFVRRKSLDQFAVLLMLLACWGCAGASPGSPAAVVETAPSSGMTAASGGAAGKANAGGGMTGMWEGSSRASCNAFNPMAFNTRCNAINRITLTMVQEGAKITGFYKCSVGTTDCRNQNDSGNIASGTDKNGRLSLRIMLPDGSSCIFNGAKVKHNVIAGSYSCYQGGGLVEQGSYAVKRNY